MVKNIADGKEQATVEKQKALLWELIYFQEQRNARNLSYITSRAKKMIAKFFSFLNLPECQHKDSAIYQFWLKGAFQKKSRNSL